jgi:hypothetical protein
MPTALLRQTFEDLSSVVDPATGFSKDNQQSKDAALRVLQTDWLGEKQHVAKKLSRLLTRNSTPQVLSFIAVWPEASRAAAQAVLVAWLFFLKEATPQFAYRAELGQHAIALAQHKVRFDAVVNELKLSEPSHIAQFLTKKETWLPWLGELQATVKARIKALYTGVSRQYDSAYGGYVPIFHQDFKRLNLVLPAETDLNKQVDLLNAFEQAKKNHTTSDFKRANTTRAFQAMIPVLVNCVNGKIKAKCDTPGPQWCLTTRPYQHQDLGHLKTAIAYLIRLADLIPSVPADQAAGIFGQESKATEPPAAIEKQANLYSKLACLEAVPAVAEAKSACEAKQLRGQVASLTGSIERLGSENERRQQQITQLEQVLMSSKSIQAELEKRWLDDQTLRDENKRLTDVVETTAGQNAELMRQNEALRVKIGNNEKTINGHSKEVADLAKAHEAEKANMQIQFDVDKKAIQSQLAARAEPIQKNLTYLGAGAFITSLFFGAMRVGLFTLIEKEKDHFSGMLTVVLLSVAAVTALGYFLSDYMAKPVAVSDQLQQPLQV